MKRSNNSRRRAGFTLFELVVVLAILAVVTTLAIRSLDGLEDQSRYEKNVRGFEELSAAVLGSPDDRAADGTRTVNGFVADMGRLPEAVSMIEGGIEKFTLAELWQEPQGSFRYEMRQAMADSDVYVPSGWRGPYLRRPMDAKNPLDGWGNPLITPDDTGYSRLRTPAGGPVTAADPEIGFVRHLGANGSEDTVSPVNLYDVDGEIRLSGDKSRTRLTGIVTMRDGKEGDEGELILATNLAGNSVTVVVYGPNPDDAREIIVVASFTTPGNQEPTNPHPFTISAEPNGPTIGPRAVRAYLHLKDTPYTTALRRSGVKSVVLRAGANVVNPTIFWGGSPP